MFIRTLLGTTSLVVMATASATAQVVTNPAMPFTNSGSINQLIFNDGAVHTGDVTNASTGQINFSGSNDAAVSITGTTAINGGLFNQGTVSAVNTSNGIVEGLNIATVGNLTNSGTITVSGGTGFNIGLALGSATSLTNSGTLSVSGGGSVTGINENGVSGNLLNSGTLNVTTTATNGLAMVFSLSGNGISGALINTGAINATAATGGALLYFGNSTSLLGGFRNDGAITMSGRSAEGPTSLFGMKGGIVNNGTMTFTGTGAAGGASGVVLVASLSGTFAGGVVNNGTINVSGTLASTLASPIAGGPTAIAVSAGLIGQPALPYGGTITGGITNNGTINVVGLGSSAVGIGLNPLVGGGAGTVTIDAVTNAGLINVSAAGSGATGIQIGNGLPVVVGAVTNSGTINATTGIEIDGGGRITTALTNTGTINAQTAISTVNAAAATTINQNGGALNGAVLLSATQADVLNVNGGTLNGQITGGAATTMTMTGGAVLVGPTVADTIGTYRQTGGTLTFAVTPDATTHGSIAAAGTATLGGMVGLALQPGLYATSTTYANVLSAGSPISTRLAQVQAVAAGTATPLAYFSAAAVYHGSSVDLTLTRQGFGALSGQTRNQQAVGRALDAVFSPGLTGGAATFFTGLLQSTSAAQAGAIIDQVSGAGASNAQQTAFYASDAFVSTMMDQGRTLLTGGTAGGAVVSAPASQYAETLANRPVFKAMAPRAPERTWSVWGAGFGGNAHLGGDAGVGSADASLRTAGGAFGVTYRAPDWLLGAAVAGSTSSFSVPSLATRGDLDAGHVGVFGTVRWGQLYTSGSLTYAHADNTINRAINVPGLSEQTNGKFGSDLFGGRFEAGWRERVGVLNVTPFAALQFAQLWQPAYRETSVSAAGAGTLGLSYAAKSVNSLPLFLGAQLDTRVALTEDAVWTPSLRVSWVHEFNPTRSVTATLVNLGNSTFTVDGPRAASDAARVELGSQLALSNGLALFANASGEFGDRTHAYVASGGLRGSW
ncbi:MAG: autotransporter domain-containing protein [Pseudomonadota bacterium]